MKKILVEEKNNDLMVNEDAVITIFNTDLKTLNLNINDNVKLIINDFRIIEKGETKITLNLKKNCQVNYNHSFINRGKYLLNVHTNYEGDNSELVFNTHGISDSGESIINVDGILNLKINNVLLENIKLININEGRGTIIPNILVSSDAVVANHKATIGNISKEELEYLMSKGISYDESRNLILTGFLINLFDSNKLITQIKEIINWRG